MMPAYAIIPARGGSKGVKHKNIRLLRGKPLIAYAIEAALQSSSLSRVVVTTDSPEIAAIAKSYGAELPFLRPAALAQDSSPDRDYLLHAIEWFKTHEQAAPDLWAILRPSTPIRDPALIDQALLKMKQQAGLATALRSVHALPEPPQKMLQIENGWLQGFFPADTRPEYFNLPRQLFPTAYQPNGYIDIVKTDYITQTESGIFGPHMLGFETPYSVEIDTESEFEYLAYIMEKMEKLEKQDV